MEQHFQLFIKQSFYIKLWDEMEFLWKRMDNVCNNFDTKFNLETVLILQKLMKLKKK